MINKLKQIINDHRAMNLIRSNFGDVYLIAVVGQDYHGWDCTVNQDDNTINFDTDPAIAIIHSYTLSEKYE